MEFYQWVGWPVGVGDGVPLGVRVVVGVGLPVGADDGLPVAVAVADGVPVGMPGIVVMAGLLEGDVVGVADGTGVPVVAYVVRLAHSSGRKYSVGMPLARIWLMPPWCRLRYQLPGPGTLVTPVTTRVWLMT